MFYQLALHWPHVMRQEYPEAYGWAVLKHHLGQRREALGMGSALVQTATFEAVSLPRAGAARGAGGQARAIRGDRASAGAAVLRSNVRFAKRRLARELSADDGGE